MIDRMQVHCRRTLVMSVGSSNAAALVIIAARLGAMVPACRLIFGAKTDRTEELARAILYLNVLDRQEIKE